MRNVGNLVKSKSKSHQKFRCEKLYLFILAYFILPICANEYKCKCYYISIDRQPL